MPAKYCPTCQRRFSSAERLCPADSSVLSLNDPYRLVGRTLLDKYRIDALVGLGGMGAVYYAYHSGIDRHVAFKILQPNIALSDDHVVELFEREAKLAGRLFHENIVDVTDAGRGDEDLAYIVMEWLEGRTLDEELLKKERFSFTRAAGITRQVAAALGEAHRKHVIHRDLKPGNIMLVDSPTVRDHVKVLDFGIGKALEETMASSMVSIVLGTPHYASPEQLTVGGRIDRRSDIYSLGVILYRMLGGKLPFNSPSMGEVIQMQLTAEPAPLITLRPETPPAVERLVISMLAKDPARRPQSVAELVATLDHTLPHMEAADAAHDGETTIQRAHDPVGRATESLYAGAPLRETFTTNVQRTNRAKTPAIYATIIGAALVASGYGLYQYVSGVGGPEISRAPVAAPPSPSATVAEIPSPSPDPTSVVTPPPARSRLDERRLADKHFEKALSLYQQGMYQAALGECRRALALYPQHENARDLQRKISDLMRILNPR
ncbi:MAG: protein kinase [Chloracidobacterium sp.]|nr:protein kinase [Chloracidobacterium sp.]